MKPYVSDVDFDLYHGDALAVLANLPTASVSACVTSPPYLDARPEYPSPTLEEFWSIFVELRRVVIGPALVNVGRLWRDHVEQLWWVDLLEQIEDAGWHLLDTLIWAKPNANPIQGEIYTNAHEYVFVLGDPGITLNTDAVRTPYSEESIARLGRKFFHNAGVKGYDRPEHRRGPGSAHELGARPRSYIEITAGGEKGNKHPAPMPTELAEHLVAVASYPGQIVVDPFAGSGTTAVAARKLGRKSILVERAESYCYMASVRLAQQSLLSAWEESA